MGKPFWTVQVGPMYSQGHHKREVEGHLAQTEEKAKRPQRQRLEQCSHTRAMGLGSCQSQRGRSRLFWRLWQEHNPAVSLILASQGPLRGNQFVLTCYSSHRNPMQ